MLFHVLWKNFEQIIANTINTRSETKQDWNFSQTFVILYKNALIVFQFFFIFV